VAVVPSAETKTYSNLTLVLTFKSLLTAGVVRVIVEPVAVKLLNLIEAPLAVTALIVIEVTALTASRVDERVIEPIVGSLSAIFDDTVLETACWTPFDTNSTMTS
jgi:hypothetical protein